MNASIADMTFIVELHLLGDSSSNAHAAAVARASSRRSKFVHAFGMARISLC
jgi:hypothetical protein